MCRTGFQGGPACPPLQVAYSCFVEACVLHDPGAREDDEMYDQASLLSLPSRH